MTRSIRSEAAKMSDRRRDGLARPLASRTAAATALLCLVVTVTMSPPAIADEQQAREHFERAQKAYNLGDYKQAIDLYERAYRAMPAAAFLFNIAQSHRLQYGVDQEVSHLRKALALYKSYLREAENPPNRKTVEKIVGELQAMLEQFERRVEKQQRAGRLLMRGEVGAAVLLDGKTIGTLPVNVEVSAGAHVVRIEKGGYGPWESTVRVPPGAQVELPVALEPLEQRQQSGATAKPFYRRWWFWTLTAAVVAAGAGTGIYFATRKDDGPAVPEIDLR